VKSTLTSGFDLALVEEPDSLLEKLLLRTGVVATFEALVPFVVAGPLHHHEIAATPQLRSPAKWLHIADRPWVTEVQHPGKNLVTREKADKEHDVNRGG
jgi:hypothetical protein